MTVRTGIGVACAIIGFGLNAENLLQMQDKEGNPLAPVVVRFTTRAGK